MNGYLKILFLPLLYLTFFYSSAQTINCNNELFGGGLKSPDIEYFEGSRYLYDDFKMGKVYYNDSKMIQLPLRLNLHNDEFEFIKNDSIYAFAMAGNIDRVVLEDEVFIYLEENEMTDLSGFVKVWTPELYPTILTKMKKDFFKKSTGRAFGFPKPDRFVRGTDKHYLMMSNTEISRIISAKDLIENLDQHSSELLEFAREEKISKGKGDELTKLLSHYHKLEN